MKRIAIKAEPELIVKDTFALTVLGQQIEGKRTVLLLPLQGQIKVLAGINTEIILS